MIDTSEHASTADLYSEFHRELRRIAQRLMLRERSAHTLSATALVNEAYLRMTPQSAAGHVWPSRGQFFASAAESMRRVLIDHARRRKAQKRSGQRQAIQLESIGEQIDGNLDWVLDLAEGLERLAKQDSKAAMLVHLHVFGGLSIADAGAAVGLSRWGSYQAWKFAVAWFSTQRD